MMTAIALSSSSLDRYIYCLLILASSSDVLRANVIDSVIGPYPRSSVAPGRRRHSTVIIFILNINRANPRNSIIIRFILCRWDNYPDTFLIEEMQFFLEELEFLELEMICNKM